VRVAQPARLLADAADTRQPVKRTATWVEAADGVVFSVDEVDATDGIDTDSGWSHQAAERPRLVNERASIGRLGSQAQTVVARRLLEAVEDQRPPADLRIQQEVAHLVGQVDGERDERAHKAYRTEMSWPCE
jgi:hypothetical protein